MQTWNHQPNFASGDGKNSIMQLLRRQSADSLQKEALLSCKLTRADLLPFFRRLEAILLEPDSVQKQSTLVYWSSGDASWLLPAKAEYQLLSRATLACAAFSEHRQGQNKHDEFCFSLLSKELSVMVYGFELEAGSGASGLYHSTLAFDQQLIKRVFNAMAPFWEFIDPSQAHKVESSVSSLEAGKTAKRFSNSLAKFWSELSAPLEKQQDESSKQAKGAAGKEQSAQTLDPAVAKSGSDSQVVYDLKKRIASDYPYPIANPYRTLDCLTDAAERYKEQLRLVENLLAFLAGLSLALTLEEDPSIMGALKTSLSSGISVGHWRELIRKCTLVWKNSSVKHIPLAACLLDLQVEQVERGFGKAIEQLVRARNDFAHHRGPTAESQIEKESLRIAELLKSAIEETDFLCRFPVRIVRAIDVLPSGLIKMVCLKASGDHPALAQEELNLKQGFPKGHLIINSGDSNWLSLYPFLSQDICPKCGMMEIYLLDKWKFDRNQLYLRSFERGHTIESQALSDALKAAAPAKFFNTNRPPQRNQNK